MKVLSVIWHPLWMPLYVLGMYKLLLPAEFPRQEMDIRLFFFCVFYPLVAVFIMRRMNMLSSWAMEDKKDRIAPLMVLIVCYLLTILYVRKIDFSIHYQYFMFSAVLSLWAAFFVNNFRKLSLHSLAISVVFFHFILEWITYGAVGYGIAVAAAWAVLLMVLYARYRVHTRAELFLGVSVGVGVVLFGWLLYPFLGG